ncbi:hypothetical protein CPLU01_07042 [Colletotrichum plurivorum]|uniref:Uncharacterized protein n=1 Tax=Colletotrichum plurivorum TaxID=2175906 RepID=A0A8H6NF08_9PEZI|nr:hypothetical protein CPLU01_07042 [Colletotrichum plurivorum]
MTPSPEKRGREGEEEMGRCNRHQTVAISTGGKLSQTTTPGPETPGYQDAGEAAAKGDEGGVTATERASRAHTIYPFPRLSSRDVGFMKEVDNEGGRRRQLRMGVASPLMRLLLSPNKRSAARHRGGGLALRDPGTLRLVGKGRSAGTLALCSSQLLTPTGRSSVRMSRFDAQLQGLDVGDHGRVAASPLVLLPFVSNGHAGRGLRLAVVIKLELAADAR